LKLKGVAIIEKQKEESELKDEKEKEKRREIRYEKNRWEKLKRS